jgi:SAM-dependent methyltransferase
MGLRPSIACNLCGGVDAETVRQRDRHGHMLRSVICRQCGLVWTDPRPAPEQVRDFYLQDYRLEYKGIRQPKAKHTYRAGRAALERFRRLRAILRAGARILDVGAGGGEVVYVGRALGYDISGIEPNAGYAAYGAKVLSVPVRHSTYQAADIEPHAYDIVTMFHTVEHLEDPLDVMRRASGWLRSDGFLVVEVPSVEAVCHQPHQQFHRGHLYHFNIATLEQTGRRAGFSVESSGTSRDGGVIWAIFQKPVAPLPAVPGAIPGNYERVRRVLRRHTTLRHAFSRYPYIRPLAKLAVRIDEWRHVRTASRPTEILDALVARSMVGP